MADSQVLDATAVPVVLRRGREFPRARPLAVPGIREVLAIWGLLGALTLAVTITYPRFPVSEFYHVSMSGIEGGLGRALVLLNFPVAFIAIALMSFAVARLYTLPDSHVLTNRNHEQHHVSHARCQ